MPTTSLLSPNPLSIPPTLISPSFDASIPGTSMTLAPPLLGPSFITNIPGTSMTLAPSPSGPSAVFYIPPRGGYRKKKPKVKN